MWLIHHCLAFHATCQPRSFAGTAEELVFLACAVVAVPGLIVFLNWVDSLL